MWLFFLHRPVCLNRSLNEICCVLYCKCCILSCCGSVRLLPWPGSFLYYLFLIYHETGSNWGAFIYSPAWFGSPKASLHCYLLQSDHVNSSDKKKRIIISILILMSVVLPRVTPPPFTGQGESLNRLTKIILKEVWTRWPLHWHTSHRIWPNASRFYSGVCLYHRHPNTK